jgi:hypothetical protein
MWFHSHLTNGNQPNAGVLEHAPLIGGTVEGVIAQQTGTLWQFVGYLMDRCQVMKPGREHVKAHRYPIGPTDEV